MRFAAVGLVLSGLLLPPAIAVPQPVPSLTNSVAQAPTPTAEEQIVEAVRLNNEGAALVYKTLVGPDQFKQALTLFERALQIFRQYKATAGTANSLTHIGYVHLRQGELPKALTLFQQAIALAQQDQYQEGEWIARSYLAEVYANQNQNAKALEAYQQALVILKRLKVANSSGFSEGSSEQILLTDIAATYFRMGQSAKALEMYQQALTLQTASQDRIGSAQTLNNIGVVQVNLGRYAEAIAAYEAALKTVTEIGNCYRSDSGSRLCFYGDEAAILNNLSAVYFSLGQYQKALEYSERASQIYRRFQQEPQPDSTERSIRLLYDAIGQKTTVLPPSGTRAVGGSALGKDSFLRLGQALHLSNIGQLYFYQEDYSNALKFYQQALTIYQENQTTIGQASALNQIGQVYSHQNQIPQAIATYEQALKVFRTFGDQAGEGVVLSNLGAAYERQNLLKQALTAYEQALVLHRKVGDRASTGITLSNQGRTFLRDGQTRKAVASLQAAVDVWESLRPGLTDENRVALFETQLDTYRTLQKALVTQQQANPALEVAERGRGRAFAELLARRLENPGTGKRVDSQQATRSPSLAQIQQIAKTQQATLVQYSIIDDETLYVWVIQPTGTITFRSVNLSPILKNQVPLNEHVQQVRIRVFRGQTVSATTSGTASLSSLYQALIQPIADLLPKDPNHHVVLIPQGALFLVPFAALQDQQGTFLIERHTLLTAPSIQVMALTHPRSPQPAMGIQLIVGNPKMPATTNSTGTREQLEPLPGAEQEAKTIAQLLQTTALIGEQATEATVVQQMPTAQLIHLATHGLLDEVRGIGSAIALTPSGSNDGFLTADEILNLNLQANLVVLSACDTGRGKITGDGVIGLSRSLLAAGAGSVIVSLWAVPDAPTAELMTQFYQQNKGDRAQALRQAMLKTLQTYPHPKDWAAFTLIGNTQ